MTPEDDELFEQATTRAVIPGQSRTSAEWMTHVDRPITRRPATRYDKDLLRAIFTDSRSSWFAALPVALAAALLDVQFRAHRNDRELRWPHSVDQIIELQGVPAGRVTVWIGADEIRIIDLALLPGFRGQGIGRTILTDVKQEAAELCLPLRMAAAKQCDGRPSWPTLRMTVIGESDTDIELEA
ncbi:MAG: GNAT family N-acetyltransferase [Nakamurella sp.]